MSQPLDRDRPLWRHGWSKGSKVDDGTRVQVHHCMVDGIAGVGLLRALLDLESTTKVGVPNHGNPNRNRAPCSKSSMPGAAWPAVSRPPYDAFPGFSPSHDHDPHRRWNGARPCPLRW